ncbi:dihydrolipoamide acetyltransferase [Sesbania bispinosa]|nr:dihydrolipoamide acetyltransferase [Sesbania bispinosa]
MESVSVALVLSPDNREADLERSWESLKLLPDMGVMGYIMFTNEPMRRFVITVQTPNDASSRPLNGRNLPNVRHHKRINASINLDRWKRLPIATVGKRYALKYHVAFIKQALQPFKSRPINAQVMMMGIKCRGRRMA